MPLKDKEIRRSSAVLMPIFSLPSPYGIGTLGKEAKRFIDFLCEAKQSWWQILPLGPTGFGDSPYQSLSTFAGNPYFIDLDLLIEDGLLEEKEVKSIKWFAREDKVDYGILYENRLALLRKAMERGFQKERAEIECFLSENERWLPDFALFMALKSHFGMKEWLSWDEDIRLRKPEAVERYKALLKEDIDFFIYIQYLFFKQWNEIKNYAHEKGIGIIGDLPIYVALDSVDVWSSPDSFQLDEKNVPIEVAGVPPDYFSENGQLWGNPLYDYETMGKKGYGWWIDRIDGAAKLYDVIRIDHFRGFADYWSVGFGEKTAVNGKWVKGPGMDLIGVLKSWFPDLSFIAEDLGAHSDATDELLSDSGFPGMKVLEFAFDDSKFNSHLPHNYKENSICYTGTHDNSTLRGWLETADKDELKKAEKYLGLNEKEGYVWGIIRGGMSSVAKLFVAQIQDYLELPDSARINTPGTAEGNWTWRLTEELTDELAKKIAKLTLIYDRRWL